MWHVQVCAIAVPPIPMPLACISPSLMSCSLTSRALVPHANSVFSLSQSLSCGPCPCVARRPARSCHTPAPYARGHPLALCPCACLLPTCSCHMLPLAMAPSPLPTSYSAQWSCELSSWKLPASAVSVTGIMPSSQSFPTHLAGTQKVTNKLVLCLPSEVKTRHAIMSPWPSSVTS